MNREDFYAVSASIGTFSDENSFKRKLMSTLIKGTKAYKKVFAIENSEEPGMPDLLLIDIDDTSRFIETKYAQKAVVKFKRSQIPWYMRNKDLNISIVCYNDLTTNVHTFSAEFLLKNGASKTFKLKEEIG